MNDKADMKFAEAGRKFRSPKGKNLQVVFPSETQRSLATELRPGHMLISKDIYAIECSWVDSGNMEAYRPLLEVLRFLAFPDVLLCSLVCSSWRRAADSNELWQCIGSTHGLESISKLEFCGAVYQSSLFVSKHRLFGVYNCILGTWRRISIEKRIHFSHSRSHVVLPNGLMVICGGTHKHVYTYHLLTKQLKEVKPMIKRRQNPGLCCVDDFVYAFGGNFSESFSSCEKLSLQQWTWAEMPDMLVPRARVNPCRSGKVVFLCGGTSESLDCEQYDILRNEFTLLQLNLTDGPVFAVMIRCALVVITRNAIYRSGEESMHKVDPWYLCSGMSPVVLGQKVLFSRNWDTIYRLDVQTYAFEQVFPAAE